MTYVPAGRPRTYTDADLAYARAQRAAGVKWTDIHAKIGKGTVGSLKNALSRYGGKPLTPSPPEPIPAEAVVEPWDARPRLPEPPPASALAPRPPPPDDPPPADVDLLEFVRGMTQKAIAQSRSADPREASQGMKIAADLAKLQARIEKDRRVETDFVQIARSEVDELRSELRDRVKVITSRPIHCARCHKELVAEFVETHRRD